jgi:hypothetical protein
MSAILLLCPNNAPLTSQADLSEQIFDSSLSLLQSSPVHFSADVTQKMWGLFGHLTIIVGFRDSLGSVKEWDILNHILHPHSHKCAEQCYN